MKERQAVFLTVHLRVITARNEIGSCESRQLDCLAGHRELPLEDLTGEGLRGWIRGVIDHETTMAQDTFHPPPECLGHRATWLVGLSKGVEERRAEFRRWEDLIELIEGGKDGVGEADITDRADGLSWRVAVGPGG